MSTLKRHIVVWAFSYDLFDGVAVCEYVRPRLSLPRCPCAHNQPRFCRFLPHTHTSIGAHMCWMGVCDCVWRVFVWCTLASCKRRQVHIFPFSVCTNWNVHKYRIFAIYPSGVFFFRRTAAGARSLARSLLLLTVMLMLQRQICTQRSNTRNSAASSRSHIYLQSQNDPRTYQLLSSSTPCTRTSHKHIFCFFCAASIRPSCYSFVLWKRTECASVLHSIHLPTPHAVHNKHKHIERQNRK